MKRLLKRGIVVLALAAPMLVVQSDDANAQRRRDRDRYWRGYWGWYDRDYRPYYGRRYRSDYRYSDPYYGDRYDYGYPYYGRSWYGPRQGVQIGPVGVYWR